MRRPRFLDVVWCHFPERERPDAPGPKARPVLVMGVAGNGELIVAAYGTSQAHAAPKDWEVRHEAQRGMLTSFDLSRMAGVPATAAYFPSHLPALRKSRPRACPN